MKPCPPLIGASLFSMSELHLGVGGGGGGGVGVHPELASTSHALRINYIICQSVLYVTSPRVLHHPEEGLSTRSKDELEFYI